MGPLADGYFSILFGILTYCATVIVWLINTIICSSTSNAVIPARIVTVFFRIR